MLPCSSDKYNSLDNYRMWDKHWIWTSFCLLPEKHYFSAFWHSHLIKEKMMNCKRDHIFDCDWLKKYINVWLFKKTWKSNRAPGNSDLQPEREREREREWEKWSFEMFFLMIRTKAEESRVLNSHFLTSDAERMRASTLWVWRCYSGWEHHHYSAQ